jgi:hypothetical protein
MTKDPKQAEKQRTTALGVVAGLLVLGLGISVLRAPRAETTSSEKTLPAKTGGVTPLTSVAVTHDPESLAKKYRPIIDAEPFMVRNFNRPRGGTNPRGPGPDVGPETSGSTSYGSASTVALWLTGIVSIGTGTQAVLEDRGSGKGIVVKTGDKLGKDRSIAEVRTDSLVFASIAAVGTKTLGFGEKLELPRAEVVDRLGSLGPPSSASTTSSSSSPINWGGSSAAKLPELTEEKKTSVLEELKKKRAASLGQQQPPKPEEKK